jgi:hypothetical protein
MRFLGFKGSDLETLAEDLSSIPKTSRSIIDRLLQQKEGGVSPAREPAAKVFKSRGAELRREGEDPDLEFIEQELAKVYRTPSNYGEVSLAEQFLGEQRKSSALSHLDTMPLSQAKLDPVQHLDLRIDAKEQTLEEGAKQACPVKVVKLQLQKGGGRQREISVEQIFGEEQRMSVASTTRFLNIQEGSVPP